MLLTVSVAFFTAASIALPPSQRSKCPIGETIRAREAQSPLDDGRQIGALHADSVHSFVSSDRRIGGFKVLSNLPSKVKLESGCWLGWGVDEKNGTILTFMDDSAYPSSESRHQVAPQSPPKIKGYRFVNASLGYSGSLQWIGIWVAEDGSEKSRIAGFDDESERACQLYAEVPIRLALIDTFPGLHGDLWISAINNPPSGKPVHWFRAVYPSSFVQRKPLGPC